MTTADALQTRVNPPLTDALTERLEAIWLAVSHAGGAVGFEAGATAADVARGAARMWDAVLDGTTDLIVASEGTATVGFGFLTPSSAPVGAHRATLTKLQRHPSRAGAAIGAVLLAAIEAHARTRGVSLITLDVRGGTGRDAFYAAHGYRTVAVLPGWVRVDGHDEELIVMQKRLDQQTAAARASVGTPTDAVPPGAVTSGTASVTASTMQVRRLDPDLPLPRYAKAGDAGMDLFARRGLTLPPGMRTLMPTGLAVAIPAGHVGLVHPRSGLAVRLGLSIVNAPGTIDAGYRGELMVPLINLDTSATIRLERGDRIAQLVVQRVEQVQLVEVDELDETDRGATGFGSSGI